MTKRLIILWILSVVGGAFMGAAIALIMTNYPQPSCPTEDSCVPMYYDHSWHIEKVRE